MLDYLVSFLSSREMISQSGIEPLVTPFSLGISPLSFGSLGSFWIMIILFFKKGSLKPHKQSVQQVSHHSWRATLTKDSPPMSKQTQTGDSEQTSHVSVKTSMFLFSSSGKC